MNKKLRIIYHAFGGKLVGNSSMKLIVCKAVSILPEEMIIFITKNCWFIASMEDAWAFTFTGNDLKNQHLIFLSDELLEQDEKQIVHTIIHEIAHVMLKHRNSTLVQQSKEEIQFQEDEAELFVKKYIDNNTS